MKREIKFRSWDKERMIYFSDMSIGLKKGKRISPYVYFAKDTFGNSVKLGSHEIMQFTGLKDKNGKEIYEGDILKLQYPMNYGFGGIHNKEIIVSISFESGCFWFTGDGHTDCNWHFYNDYEVIGNIYESPDLLK